MIGKAGIRADERFAALQIFGFKIDAVGGKNELGFATRGAGALL